MDISEIDAMAEALAKQCGMRCTVYKSWEGSRLDSLYVQIRLRPAADPQDANDWHAINGWSLSDLPYVRDEMVAFIQQHRKEEAA